MRGPYFQTGSHAFCPGLRTPFKFGGERVLSSFSFFFFFFPAAKCIMDAVYTGWNLWLSPKRNSECVSSCIKGKKKKSSKVRKKKRSNRFIWSLNGESFLGERWRQGASESPADPGRDLVSSPFHHKWKTQRPKGSFKVRTTCLWDTEGQIQPHLE